MLISNISVDDNSHSLETSRINNYSITAPGDISLFGYDDTQYFETPRIKKSQCRCTK